ncbi:MAG: hypothetical protein GY725_22485 [bacterium]|nr:hypothetical protein [bacterium]
MRDPIGEVPPGYVVHRVADVWLILDRNETPDLMRLRLADPAVRKTLFARGPRRGRGTTPSVALRHDLRVVLRRYRHGGLLGWLTGSLYVGTSRAAEELSVTAAAEALDAPVPHALCVVLWPVFGPFWSAMIGTREEPNASELLGVLHSLKDVKARRILIAEVADAVRRLHDAGVDHRDLQLRNLLVVPNSGGRRIVAVDLDKAVFHGSGGLSSSVRANNLGRLHRSAVKNGLAGSRIGPRELAIFASAYTRGDRELRAELRGWTRRERIKLALHQLRYRFSSSLTQPADSPLRPA